jgi:iron complex transport system substrate-binding protein
MPIHCVRPVELDILHELDSIEMAEGLITRRRFIIGAGALAVGAITGCGRAEQATAPAATPATRQVKHALGTISVPANPQRVVALHDTAVTYPLLDVGFRVMASAGTAQGIRAGKHDVSTIQFVGTIRDPDLETIAGLKPDLIIGLKQNDEPQYDQLSQLAPTVLIDYDGEGMSLFDIHRATAEVVGHLPQFDAMVRRVDERTAALKQRLAPLADTLEVSAFSAAPDGIFIYYGITTPWTAAFERLGLRLPAAMPPSYDQLQTMLSLERLSDFDADAIFVLSYPEGEAALAELQQSPLFASLNAANKQQVFTVDYNEWQYARVPGIETVYDDIETYLLARQIDTSTDFR